MEENKPPSAKLKQAKLPFFKNTPVTVKSNILGQGKKRRNSSSSCLDSPTKSSKPGKPLNLIAVDNTECQNTKAQKIRKISFVKTLDGNDHEVSSSSEAEAGNNKCHNGNFMDRFVRKLPQDAQQEISSTNEMFEMSHQNDLHIDEPESANVDQNNMEKSLQIGTKDLTIDPDCIIIDDSEDANMEKVDTDSDTSKVHCNVVNCSSPKPDSKLSTNASEISKDENIVSDNDKDCRVSPVNCSEKEKCSSNEEAENSAADLNYSSADKDSSITSEESFDDSIRDLSVSVAGCSTPIKIRDSDGSDADVTLDVSQITPNTPATGSGRKRRKVNSATKAVKEASRLKRENEKLERKRKLESEKAEKERIRKEMKETKEKQKQELKEKLEKEKQDKEKAKEEEKKKREDERIKKEEDKKKKQAAIDAKQEEKRKKEDERKQKEEDKLREEEEKKKKEAKTKQAFQSFFIKPKEINTKPVNSKSSIGIFIAFELKKDMHLAPSVRRDVLSEEEKNNLDQILANNENGVNTFLEQLKQGNVIPQKTGRVLRKNPQPVEDVTIIHDSEALKKVMHCVKLLQFHTDHRPPYYGTWRKKPTLTPRNPWKKDQSVFDYDVDSDDEWEEEEPGESLSCSDGEEEKGEEVDDDDDDGWMVPHGYLSEDEGCNEDDEITPDKLKLQQLAKAKAWEEGQKRKLQAAPVITVACFFENSPSKKMMGDVRLLYEFKAVALACTPIQTSLFISSEAEKLEETISEGVLTTPTQKGFHKMTVPDEAMPDLIRLVHGNTCGIKRLIREFRVYWLRKSNPPAAIDKDSPCEADRLGDSFTDKNLDSSNLNESLNESISITEPDEHLCDKVNNASDKKVKEEGYGCNISKRQLDMKITAMAIREKRAGFNKICWYVRDTVLTQFNMSDLQLTNTWVHLLPVPVRSPAVNVNKSAESSVPGSSKIAKPRAQKTNKIMESSVPRASKVIKLSEQNSDTITACSDVSAEMKDGENIEAKETPSKKTAKDQRSIKDFTLTKKELVEKMANQQDINIADSSKQIIIAVQETPKVKKKRNSQKCIMDFASLPGGKKKRANNNSTPRSPHITNNISSSSNVEIINIDSDSNTEVISSGIEGSQIVSCPENTAPEFKHSITASENGLSNLVNSVLDVSPDTVTKSVPTTSKDVVPMEVDITATDTSKEESTTESQNNISEVGKCDIECIVID